MDPRLIRLVVGAALFDLAKVSIIKLKGVNGPIYEDPTFIPVASTKQFGIKSDSDEQGGGWTTMINFSDVEYMH